MQPLEQLVFFKLAQIAPDGGFGDVKIAGQFLDTVAAVLVDNLNDLFFTF